MTMLPKNENNSSTEYLCFELSELSAFLTDILSHTGPIDSSSWKYPGENVSTLDVVCKYTSHHQDCSEKQHILLLELIVDRLLLLIEVASFQLKNYISKMRLEEGVVPSSGEPKSTRPLIPTIAKEYWKIVSVLTSNCPKISKLKDMKSASSTSIINIVETTDDSCQTEEEDSGPVHEDSSAIISKMQEAVGEACQKLQLSSTVVALRDRGPGIGLNMQLAEILADLEQLVKYSTGLRSSMTKLTKELRKEFSEALRKERSASDIAKERSRLKEDSLRRQFESAKQKLEMIEKDNANLRERLTEATSKSEKSAKAERENSERVQMQEQMLLDGERTNQKLDSELTELHSILAQKEMELRNLKNRYEQDQKETMSTMRRLLDDNRQRLSDIDVIKFDNDKQLKELVELRTRIRNERQETQCNFLNLQKRVDSLDHGLDGIWKETSERENYLVNYPDLVSPAPAQPSGDDVLADMKAQFRSNAIRIEVLSDQNEKLERALIRLTQMNIM